jgi:penicillin V acylase-like amidase (Ntn superfamily)
MTANSAVEATGYRRLTVDVTGITLTSKDGAAVLGRTMEWLARRCRTGPPLRLDPPREPLRAGPAGFDAVEE